MFPVNLAVLKGGIVCGFEPPFFFGTINAFEWVPYNGWNPLFIMCWEPLLLKMGGSPLYVVMFEKECNTKISS